MKRSLFGLVLAAALIVTAPVAQATLIHFQFFLSGLNESPPTPSAGTGLVNLFLDTTAQTLQGGIGFSGLTTGTTAAHIHCCLATPFGPGNVGVATLVPAFPGFPLGVTSGFDSFTLDLSSSAAYNPAFITAQGGLANAEASFINGLIHGLTYLNIHTTQFPGGEIRGFVAAAVPEPATMSLLAMGLAAAGFFARSRKRS